MVAKTSILKELETIYEKSGNQRKMIRLVMNNQISSI
jgi:hypothetical protein